MSKRFIGYFLIIFIVMIMILTLIMIDSSLDFFSKLPEYTDIENGKQAIDSLTEEIVLEVRNINYGFYATGRAYSVDQDERIYTYLVEETDLDVGDIVRKGDFIDRAKSVPAKTVGQIYNISYVDEHYLISVYNFENIRIKTSIDIYYFNLLQNFDNIDIIFEKKEFAGKVNEIDYTIINDKIELIIDFVDYNSISYNIIEGLTIYIKFNVGVLEDVLSIPSGLNLKNGNLVKIITSEGIKESNISMGIQGFDYIQIINKDFKPGDKIILEPQK